MSKYIDLFSNHAALYAKARPHYPPELFEHLAGLCPERRLVWDVGTGNGQAAVALAAHFERVIATDASTEQLKHAAPHPRVEYHVSTAENPALIDTPRTADVLMTDAPATVGLIQPASVDLVTIAQAIHWMDFDAFYANVRRAARPDGLIAVWCYTLPRVDERMDQLIDWFCYDVVGLYWEPRRQYVEDRLETIPFPFEEIHPPHIVQQPRSLDPSRASHGSVGAVPIRDRHGVDSPFACRSDWTLAELTAYIESWSAVQKYRRELSSDPMELLRDKLANAWGDADARRIVLSPIYLRVGRIRSFKEPIAQAIE